MQGWTFVPQNTRLRGFVDVAIVKWDLKLACDYIVAVWEFKHAIAENDYDKNEMQVYIALKVS